jgi:hypothetical protein
MVRPPRAVSILADDKVSVRRRGCLSGMSRLATDLFFLAYVPATIYIFWYGLRHGVVRADGDSTLFRGPHEAFWFGTLMLAGCVAWSLVYAADRLTDGLQRVLWQICVLLPIVGPPCFYIFVLRGRSVRTPRLWRIGILSVLCGGIVGGMGLVGASLYPKAYGLRVPEVMLVGLFWGIRFWTRRSYDPEDCFQAVRVAAMAGAVYGILAQASIVGTEPAFGMTPWAAASRAIASVYWGAACAASAACSVIVVPWLLRSVLNTTLRELLERVRGAR